MTQVRSLSWEDPLEEEMASHSSILAWKISRTEEPGGLYSPRDHKEMDTTACRHTHYLLLQYQYTCVLSFSVGSALKG